MYFFNVPSIRCDNDEIVQLNLRIPPFKIFFRNKRKMNSAIFMLLYQKGNNYMKLKCTKKPLTFYVYESSWKL